MGAEFREVLVWKWNQQAHSVLEECFSNNFKPSALLSHFCKVVHWHQNQLVSWKSQIMTAPECWVWIWVLPLTEVLQQLKISRTLSWITHVCDPTDDSENHHLQSMRKITQKAKIFSLTHFSYWKFCCTKTFGNLVNLDPVPHNLIIWWNICIFQFYHETLLDWQELVQDTQIEVETLNPQLTMLPKEIHQHKRRGNSTQTLLR